MLPKGWAATSLGEVAEFHYGKALPEKVRREGSNAVYGSNGIVGYHSSALTDGPAIIIGRKGSAGKVHFSQGPCYPIDTTYFIDDFATLESGFAFRLLGALGLDKMDRATAVPGLNRNDAYARMVSIPPLAEQCRIVAKLDTLTARIVRARAELVRVPVLAAKLRQSAITCAFDGRLTAEWRVQNPEASRSDDELEAAFVAIAGTKRRKPPLAIDWKPDFEIPPSWRWVSVDQVIAVAQYGSSSKTSENAVGIPVLRMGNIQNGEVDWASLKYLPFEHHEFPELLLAPGDVLFNRTNSFELVGKTAVFRGKTASVSFASYLIRLRCSGIVPDLLAHYLNSPIGRAWVGRVASQQVGQANVNGTKLKSLGIPLPPKGEQAEMKRLLESAFARADRLEAEAARAVKLYDRLEAAILAKAFRGELVPQDSADEPASVLLDRIRAERAAAPSVKRGRRKAATA